LWEADLRLVAHCLANSHDPERSIRASGAPPAVRQVLLGHLYREQGRLERAVDAYQRAADWLEQAGLPGAGAAYFFMGETCQALDRPEQAVAAYERAAQRAPLESQPLLALGHVYESLGQRQEALQSFQLAADVTPGWETAQIALGNALLARYDLEGAARHYLLAQIAAGDIDDRLVYDFASSLPRASVESQDERFVRNSEFAISDVTRRVIFAHPTSRIAYTLDLRQESILAFELGVDPQSWAKAGDGVTFTVTVRPDAGASGVYPAERILVSKYIDPKQNQADRRWHAFALDLAAYSGQKVTIVFETDVGPAGDQRYDWAGWGSPRLLGKASGGGVQPPS
jgi:tetratricopeptide (TPR) repeat protein